VFKLIVAVLFLYPTLLLADCSNFSGDWSGTWKIEKGYTSPITYSATSLNKISGDNVLVDLKINGDTDVYMYGYCDNTGDYMINLTGSPDIGLRGQIVSNEILLEGRENDDNVELKLIKR